MKITFLGSSHGVPEPNRKCQCIMIESGENVYFVDMGTSAIDEMRKRGMDIDRVKGIFITHMHGDHTNGLIQFVDLVTWYFKTPDPVICLPDLTAGKIIQNWLDVTLNKIKKEIRYVQTKEGEVYSDGVIRVSAVPTQHCLNSFSYVIECEGKKILITGDLKRPGEDFPPFGKETEFDLVICESAHFPATEYLPVFENMSIKSVCITHYVNWFYENAFAVKTELEKKGIPVFIATDNLEIRL